MRSSSGRLTSFSTAALLTGLLTLGASSAYAQGAKAPAKDAPKPAAAAPAADKKAAAPAAAAPAAKKDEKAAAPAAAPAAKKDEKAAAPAAAPAAKKDEKAAAAPAAKKDEKAADVAKKDDKKAAEGAKKDDKKVAAKDEKKPKLTDKQKKDAASKSFKEGEAAFEKGDYQVALDAYKAADEVLPGINPKYKIAVSLDKLNKVTDAVAAYQSFLDFVDVQAKENKKFDAKKYEEKVADAKGRIEALKKTPATVKIAATPETAPNLMVAVDGQAPVAAKDLSLTPGKHSLVYSAEGFLPSAPQDVEVAFAETKDVPAPALEKKPEPVAVVEPPPPPPPPPAPVAPTPPPPPPKSYVPAYVTLGLAGVGAVVGTIFGVSALGAKSDFEADHTVENADRTDRNALIADMSFAVAITFGVTGAVLLFGGDDKPAEQKAASLVVRKPVIAPWVTPTGGGAAAQFRF